MKGLTTHALDIAGGRPADGVRVDLCVFNGQDWTPLATATTDREGR